MKGEDTIADMEQGPPVSPADGDFSSEASASGPETPYPRSTWAKLALLGMHIQGKWVLRRLRYRHRALIRDITPLAEHLENDVFPLLTEDRHGCLALHVNQVRSSPASRDLRARGHSRSRAPKPAAPGSRPEALTEFVSLRGWNQARSSRLSWCSFSLGTT